MPSKLSPQAAEQRPPRAELEARRAAILEAVVTEYIGTATPVGSAFVAHAPGVNVSSATVRSEMAALERDGYLVQPHTSAGRIPTDKGYRFFVDHLAPPGVLGSGQRQRVRRFFDRVHGEMEDMLERASALLSELTPYAAVVISPSHESATGAVGPAGLPGPAPCAAGGGPLRRLGREADARAQRGPDRGRPGRRDGTVATRLGGRTSSPGRLLGSTPTTPRLPSCPARCRER